MDIAQINQSLFKAPLPVDKLSIEKDVLPPKSSNIPYAEVMLCEYYSLVKNLSKLDEIQFHSLQAEVTSVLDKLTVWLDSSSAINPIDLFATLRHLKQKAMNSAATPSTKAASRRTKQTLSFSYNKGYRIDS